MLFYILSDIFFFSHVLTQISFSLFFQVSTAFSVPNRTSPCTQIVPSVLPPPTPRLPPAFFSSAVSQLDSLDFFSGSSTTSVTLDALDNLSPSESGCTSNLTPVVLDSLDDLLDKAAAAQNRTEVDAGEKSLGWLDELDRLNAVTDLGGLSAVAPKPGVKAVEQLVSLDTLDSFPAVEDVVVPLPAGPLRGSDLDLLSNFNSTGYYDLLLSYCRLNWRPVLSDVRMTN